MSRQGEVFLRYPHANVAALAGVFDGIAQKIQKSLVEPELVAINVFIAYIFCFNRQFLIFGPGRRLNNIPELMQQHGKLARRLLKLYLAALNMAHIQNIIDETDEMIAGRQYFFQKFFHLIALVELRQGK